MVNKTFIGADFMGAFGVNAPRKKTVAVVTHLKLCTLKWI